MKKSMVCVFFCLVLLLNSVLPVNAQSSQSDGETIQEVTVMFAPGEFGKLSSKRYVGTFGTKIGILPVPTNKTFQTDAFNHLYFAGWYPEGADPEALIDEDYILTEDVTLCALWREKDSGKTFTDVAEGAWYREAVITCAETGLVVGTGETTFSPEMICSRAMIVTILYRMADCPAPALAEQPFSDVGETAWYHDAVLWAADGGVVSGIGGGRFAPEAPVTREQLACILTRYAAYCALDDPHGYTSITGFPDHRKVSEWAEDGMRWAVGSGLVQGRLAADRTILDPQASVTRAETVQILLAYRKLTDGAMTFFCPLYAVTVPSRWQGTVAARRCENGITFYSPNFAEIDLFSVLFSEDAAAGERFGVMRSNENDAWVCDVWFHFSTEQASTPDSASEAFCAAIFSMRRELAIYSHHAYFVS